VIKIPFLRIKPLVSKPPLIAGPLTSCQNLWNFSPNIWRLHRLLWWRKLANTKNSKSPNPKSKSKPYTKITWKKTLSKGQNSTFKYLRNLPTLLKTTYIWIPSLVEFISKSIWKISLETNIKRRKKTLWYEGSKDKQKTSEKNWKSGINFSIFLKGKFYNWPLKKHFEFEKEIY
jgi:hypothetical protein